MDKLCRRGLGVFDIKNKKIGLIKKSKIDPKTTNHHPKTNSTFPPP